MNLRRALLWFIVRVALEMSWNMVARIMAIRRVVGNGHDGDHFFSADMTSMMLRPQCYVPPSIAIQDKLLLMRRETGCLAHQNFTIFRDGESRGTRIKASEKHAKGLSRLRRQRGQPFGRHRGN